MKFNINQEVRVKLTEAGINELKRQRQELNDLIVSRGGKSLGEYEVRTDEEGYTSFQLWCLMGDFGHLMHMGNNTLPFEAEIIIGAKEAE